MSAEKEEAEETEAGQRMQLCGANDKSIELNDPGS